MSGGGEDGKEASARRGRGIRAHRVMRSDIIHGMNVDHTQLLKALKKGQIEGDIPMSEKREIAEDVHDHFTRRPKSDEDK